jgi:hypothetical protein
MDVTKLSDLKKISTHTFFGDVTVLFQRVLIVVYFSTVLLCLWLINWSHFSVVSFMAVFYIGLLVADFVSGLIHLYIDYRPLNVKKGYDRLYHFTGDRNSDEFLAMKAEIQRNSSWFDTTVYSFKMHHRNVLPNILMPYRDFFIEAVTPSFALLFCSLFVSLVFPVAVWSTYLAFFDVVVAVTALHSDIIHAWVHGSKTMPFGVKFARLMHKCKFIYSMKTHGTHHKDGLTGFCFVIGHTNFAVNWICKKLLERGVIHREDWFGESRENASA